MLLLNSFGFFYRLSKALTFQGEVNPLLKALDFFTIGMFFAFKYSLKLLVISFDRSKNKLYLLLKLKVKYEY